MSIVTDIGKMSVTNAGMPTPPIELQRENHVADPSMYSTTVNMLHEARSVLYPQNSQNMQYYQTMPTMINQNIDPGRHYIQYAPSQYPVLQSSARSVNKVTTNINTNTTNITITTTAAGVHSNRARATTSASTLLPPGKNLTTSEKDMSTYEEQQQLQQQPQQTINTANAPPWFSQTMKYFDTKLQQIENHLVSQGLQWQNTEAIVQNQNDRLNEVENQVSNLNGLKQAMTKLQISSECNEREIHQLSSKVVEYDNTIQTYSDMYDEIKSEQTTCRSDNFEIYERLDKLERENQDLKAAVEKSDRTIVDLQCRSMRDNLIFTGISEPQNENQNEFEIEAPETEDVEQTLRDFLKEEMQISRYIGFHRVHRLNSTDRSGRNDGPKPIIAKFERFSDREYVRSQAPKTLIGKPFGVREQYPKVIEDKRRQLYPIMKKYRKDKNNKVRLVRDRLYINENEYFPPDDEQNCDENAKNGAYEGRYRRYTKTRIFERSTKPMRPHQSFSHPMGRTPDSTTVAKTLNFTLPTGNRFAPLQQNDNAWKDRAESRKHKASSPLDADKDSKKYRENANSNSNPGTESETEATNMQTDAYSPQSDPPRDEGRTLPQTPIMAVPMQQGGGTTNESFAPGPAIGPNSTMTSNTVD